MTARFGSGVLAAIAVAVSVGVSAQQAARSIAPGNTVLLASYACAPDQLTRVDAIVNQAVAPVLNKHVASGKLLTWGFLATTLGGPANRHIYIWAADPVALLQARQVYLPEIMAAPQFAEYAKACGPAVVTVSNLVAVAAPAK